MPPAHRVVARLAPSVILVVLAACGRVRALDGRRGRVTAGAPGGVGTVTRVVDGDTVDVRLGRRTERVRLIGIDTPESVKPGTPVQCFALEASKHTKALLPAGTSVRLEGDAEERDRYGRLLAYIYRRSDGLFVNMALVQEGFAVPDTFAPNVAHSADFVARGLDARQAGLGLWGSCGSSIPHHDLTQLPSPP